MVRIEVPQRGGALMAGAFLVGLVGLWLLFQVVAGDLVGRLIGQKTAVATKGGLGSGIAATALGLTAGSTMGAASSTATTADRSQTSQVIWNGITLHRDVMPAFQAMYQAAAAEGIVLNGWGWRSNAKQKELRITNGCPDVCCSPSKTCRVPTAIPGTSRHETGHAIDFVDQDTKHSLTRSSRAFGWLSRNAARYGFYNLQSEPWHWSTDGN